MEALIKQARLRFSGTEENSTRGRTPSFRRENGPQKWIRSQLSRQMSSHQSGEEADYSAAVAAAAAAVAITSLEDFISMDQTQIRDGPWTSLPGTRSKIADAEPGEASISDAAKDSQKYGNFEAPDAGTNDRIPDKTVHPVPSYGKTRSHPKKRLTFADDQFPQDSTVSKDEETTGRIKRTSFRKTPTSREEEALKDTKIMKPEAAGPISPSPVPPPAIPPLNIQPAVPPKLETQVDAWEREERAKIKERYEKLNATILEWEDNKKKKARHKLEITENEQPARRTKAMHKYQIEMEQIKEIADGARAQAKDKKRNEELKVKEKANRYRAAGELPRPQACRCW